ncbi:Vacuolar fusion protein mon1 [Didymosphaeria variabile]|uniref:Vacuolar fusion protein MON1 n=1 Tax=Didymosphaeria variabile TaxID=1932322 RepID=A0A9W8XF94_9PLEO|nr:Vacuolar fusion protein mon1 [Didymosphaeria variabile]KAJ4348171.1 Vacuolar fusion protein mon1 [Didymosphaeria variabile]
MTDTPSAEPSAASGSAESNAPSLPAPAPKTKDNVEQHDFANPTINIINSLSRKTSTSGLSLASGVSREGTPPPLPPRPNLNLLDSASRPSTSHSVTPTRPRLVSKATTQLSFADSANHKNESREPSSLQASKRRSYFGLNLGSSRNTSDGEDSASIASFVPAVDAGLDTESMLGEGMGDHEKTLLASLGHDARDAESMFAPDPAFEQAFTKEFDEIEEMTQDGSNEGQPHIAMSKYAAFVSRARADSYIESIIKAWRAKMKHFLILSSAGKPIYSRHGDDQLITNYIGVVQTIISFYQSTDDTLRGFTAGDVRFVVMSKGPLNLVAITRLPESDTQLRAQLDALYMQILSTLTLPSMQRMFAVRANYDLRRPLQGTESLLSALADGFTRGSPSTLLGALECLKLRKSHRQTINSTLLKTRSPNLLYGLIVASGKLVSVVRPKKHSLHPGDLHLIFNMLFEAGSVKAGGGENWIPLCLPGFNNTGYLYMYVSFLNLEHPSEQIHERPKSSEGDPDEVAVLLISAEKEGFFEMRGMRDDLVEQLQRNHSIDNIRTAVRLGRPLATDIVPGTVLRHFLFKSRGNVQFFSPSLSPHFSTPVDRRRLLNLYSSLHSHLHAKPTSLKIHYEMSVNVISLAWSTPLFELYCVADGRTSRQALAAAAMKVVEWVRREEERIFIIGGAVF